MSNNFYISDLTPEEIAEIVNLSIDSIVVGKEHSYIPIIPGFEKEDKAPVKKLVQNHSRR